MLRGGVDRVAVGIGVAGQVEPVAAPALAIVRRGEQADRPGARRRRAECRATKASTSSGVGGRPIRSRVSRRIKVTRSASGDGSICSSSSRARRKRRSGCRTQSAFLTGGKVGRADRLKRPVIELGRRGDLLAGGEFRALVNPGSQSGDFLSRQASHRPRRSSVRRRPRKPREPIGSNPPCRRAPPARYCRP